MDEQTILTALLRAVRELQEVQDEPPEAVTADACPRECCGGWDSMREFAVLMQLEEDLGLEELPREMVFGGAGETRTLAESAKAIAEITREAGANHGR